MDEKTNLKHMDDLVTTTENINSPETSKTKEEDKSNYVKKKGENSEAAISALLSKLPELGNCFNIHHKIGEGSFSNVYLASIKGFNCDKKFAIKHLIPTSHPKRLKYELDCLNKIGGTDNVVSCDLTMRQADCVVFIMPYLQHQSFSDYVLDLSVDEARFYMKNLLLALRRVHSFNIIHRDVKPSNFLYNRETKKFLLVDFGLAQKVNEYDDNPRVKPPIPKAPVTKRKREDDDVENLDKPPLKRCALQTLSSDQLNQRPPTPASLRFSKQPLSVQQSKGQHYSSLSSSSSLKRQPLTHVNASNTTNVMTTELEPKKPMFQSLLPQKPTSAVAGTTSFVRVQNSQVQPGCLFPRPVAPVRRPECDCDGKARVCNLCLTRKAQYAPRAGTPGYRPPEVLLKYPNQTTAVDMWAAGVMMLCILSGCYPFFRSPDDITALSELITLFGSTAIVRLAKKLGRNVICSEIRKPMTLWILCENLRRRKVNGTKFDSSLPSCQQCRNSVTPDNGCLCEENCKLDSDNCFFPPSAFDLLGKLLDVDPHTRITAENALEHPFITGTNSNEQS